MINRSRHSSAHAFTLIEILLVLAVLAILISTGTPAVLGLLKSSRLTSAGDSVFNNLVEAQLTAITESTDVEVRFYELPDLAAADNSSQLRGVQLFALRPDSDGTSPGGVNEATFQQATPMTRLDHSLIISMDTTFTSLLDLKWRVDSTNSAQPRRYVAFRFHSDGSTDLPSGQPWFLTLLDHDQAKATGKRPANYFTIQIDPANGKLRTFRP